MDFFLLTKKNLQKKTVEKQDNLRSSIQPKICKTHLAIYQNFINKQKLIESQNYKQPNASQTTHKINRKFAQAVYASTS
jgi:hypothetical protein